MRIMPHKKKASGTRAQNHEQAIKAFKEARTFEMAGELEKALAGYKKVVALDPDIYEAHNNLGSVMVAMGKYDEAIEEHKKALDLKPDCPFVNANIGQAYIRQGTPEKAISHLEKALDKRPDLHETRKLLADTLLDIGMVEAAIDVFSKLQRNNPDDMGLLNAMAQLYHRAKMPGEAEKCFLRMIELKPDYAGAYNDLAMVYQITGMFSKARDTLKKGLELAPTSAILWNTLANSEQSIGQIDEAIKSFRKAIEYDPNLAVPHSNMLLSMHYISGLDPKELFEEHRRWGRMHAPPALATKHFPNKPNPMRKLRVGYISPDIRRHSVAFFLEPLLDNCDRTKFELFCYADVRFPDEWTLKLKDKFDHYRSILNMNDPHIGTLIKGDELDILIDLAGHAGSVHTAVLGYKPAPVQATYIGYPDTTGIEAVDYRITDEIADPQGAEENYVEKLVRLPGGFLCYRPLDDAPEIGNPPGLTRKFVAFGSFNREFKVSQKTLDIWCKILLAVPNSQMFMKSGAGRDNEAREYLLGQFEKRGVGRDRVHLAGFVKDQKDHLAIYREIDIALDTYPYHGTTTTIESLYMGVPVVTLSGYHHASRVGASLLTHIGVPEWIARSEDEYAAKAVALAADLPSIARLHGTLRNRLASSPLCDSRTFTKKYEYALRGMWCNWCRKEGVKLTPEQEAMAAFDFEPLDRQLRKDRDERTEKESSRSSGAGKQKAQAKQEIQMPPAVEQNLDLSAMPASQPAGQAAAAAGKNAVELAGQADAAFKAGKRLEAADLAWQALAALDADPSATAPKELLDNWQADSLESAIIRICVLNTSVSSFFEHARYSKLFLRWAKAEPRNPQPFLRFGLLSALDAAVGSAPAPNAVIDALQHADSMMRDDRSASAIALARGGLTDLTVPYDGMMIHVVPFIQSPTTYVLLEQGDWFDEDLPLFRAMIQPADNVLEIGAGIGLYSLSAAKRAAQGKVLAVEADQGLCDILGKSAKNLPNLSVKNMPKDGQTDIDALADQAGLANFNVIKLDSQQIAPAALKAAAKTVAQAAPVIFMTFHNYQYADDAIKALAEMGYEAYYFCSARQALIRWGEFGQPEETVRHFIAIKPDSLPRLEKLNW
ncbi:MAG: tetratricopeptide repeat protein [Planctomycetes bacterium]|nr:tetratricopeptide repeat protein [Planctomycetota bacterium]